MGEGTWNEHIETMTPERIVNVACDGRPTVRRSIGRPPKQWKESWVSTFTEN